MGRGTGSWKVDPVRYHRLRSGCHLRKAGPKLHREGKEGLRVGNAPPRGPVDAVVSGVGPHRDDRDLLLSPPTACRL